MWIAVQKQANCKKKQSPESHNLAHKKEITPLNSSTEKDRLLNRIVLITNMRGITGKSEVRDMPNGFTSIALRPKTKKRLEQKGTMTESFDALVNRILDEVEVAAK